MNPFNSKNKIDRAVSAAENVSKGEEKMSNSSTKTPWYLRFAPCALKLKGIAATAGIGTIYGLLFAGLLLAPLPSGKVQAQCKVQIPCYDNLEFGDATSKADCDRILQEVLKKIEDQGDAINDAYDAAIRCDTRYTEELKMNNLVHLGAMARGALQADEIMWECLGIGGLAGGTAAGVSRNLSIRIRGSTVAIGRIGSGIIGLVVSIGAFGICKTLRDDTLQSAIDVANKTKEHADEVALMKRDNCRKDTNYARAIRNRDNWNGGRYPSGKGYRYNIGNYRRAINAAKADHAKCLAHFTYGDCGGN